MAVLEYPSWKTLTRHARAAKQYSMKRLFNDDPKRASRFSIEVAGLYLDYSKNLIDDQTLQIFSDITDEAGVFESIKQMTGGARINSTENRAALHTLLRTPSSAIPDGLASKADQVFDSLDRMKKISDALRQGGWHGHSNRPIKHVVHLGIGGSYLGPRMIDESLMAQPAADISLHYIANVDAQHISQVLSKLDPDETLVIVVSKTFNTLETITNAETAREWLLTNMEKDDLSHHLVAITANTDAALRFGVDTNNILPIWDWVGGRYSVWSAVSLPIAIRYGFDVFDELLNGAAEMDRHFANSAMPENMPMILAWLGIWYQHFFGAGSHAILPYDHSMRLLPQHLQQLDMESNGKSIRTDQDKVEYPTGPIIWGGEGTNGQHAFHQLLHQGTQFVSVDFVLPLVPHHSHMDHHDKLVANCLGQSQALMLGSESTDENPSSEEPYRHMPGNRPSNTILLEKVTPQTLGALIALYEHKVFCQAVIWEINPFDQWGVELGKVLGDTIYSSIQGGSANLDASTDTLLNRYLAAKHI